MTNPIRDYYSVLGVHPSAEDVVIRAAYKALAQRYHPDRFTGSKEEAHRRMSELSIAYEVLADPLLRPKYDRRRSIFTRSVAPIFGNSARSESLDPGDVLSEEGRRRRFRVALAALLGVVLVLSVFNAFHYSARIKEWLGTSPARTPSVPITQGVAVPEAQPAPPADRSAAPTAESPAVAPSVNETTRADTRTPTTNQPAMSVTTTVEAKAKPKAPPPGMCPQREKVLGLCK